MYSVNRMDNNTKVINSNNQKSYILAAGIYYKHRTNIK